MARGEDPVPLADRFLGFPTDTANILRAENLILTPQLAIKNEAAADCHAS